MSQPYSISSSDIAGIIAEINSILADIDNRISALEGTRGICTINQRLDLVDEDQNRVGGFTNEDL